MEIRADLRIPTREQYAYIELHVEGTSEEEIVESYFRALDYYRTRELARKKASEEEVPFGNDIDWKEENAIKSKSFKR